VWHGFLLEDGDREGSVMGKVAIAVGAVAGVTILLVAALVGGLLLVSRGFPGTYVNNTSQSFGPGGPKTEVLKITFHRDGTFDGYDDISGKWELNGDKLTLHLDTSMMRGTTYTATVRHGKIHFDMAPNFMTPFGVTFTKRKPF
jgi:hypothetical protein